MHDVDALHDKNTVRLTRLRKCILKPHATANAIQNAKPIHFDVVYASGSIEKRSASLLRASQ
jgi:hypothetical protein